jgi:hypothetical protein
LSQTTELSRVKARIKALTEKTVANGCTEAEAMSAAEMVGRLLERYALSMDEIEVRTARCVQVEVTVDRLRRGQSMAAFRRSPGSAIARSGWPGLRAAIRMTQILTRPDRAFATFSLALRRTLAWRRTVRCSQPRDRH